MLPASREKRDRMSKAGDVIENPVTDEHVHPVIEEYFTVVRGRVGFRPNGRETITEFGQRLHVPAGMVHDWWNAGEEEAHVTVEIRPGGRFEEMIANLFGLAQDGKTNAKGMPNLLQAALFAQEFEDVLYFTKPPRAVQKILFTVLAPIARALGYRGSYPEYLNRQPAEVVEVESWPMPERESDSSVSEHPHQ
jgi:hypothetical protein